MLDDPGGAGQAKAGPNWGDLPWIAKSAAHGWRQWHRNEYGGITDDGALREALKPCATTTFQPRHPMCERREASAERRGFAGGCGRAIRL
jgi:hypothetical protein